MREPLATCSRAPRTAQLDPIAVKDGQSFERYRVYQTIERDYLQRWLNRPPTSVVMVKVRM